jgi:hypothetical protein
VTGIEPGTKGAPQPPEACAPGGPWKPPPGFWETFADAGPVLGRFVLKIESFMLVIGSFELKFEAPVLVLESSVVILEIPVLETIGAIEAIEELSGKGLEDFLGGGPWKSPPGFWEIFADAVLVLKISIIDKMGVIEAIEEPSGKLCVEDSSVDEESPFIKIELNKDELLVTGFGAPCTQ